MKIGITGATGQLGQLVVSYLTKMVDSSQVVALVRNVDKASGLGVESRYFDYNEPEKMDASLEGIDRLLLISGSDIGERARQHTNVIHAAKNAGISWIVYTSILHADTTSINLADEHLATEGVLKTSGMVYTILRNGWYTENYTGSIDGALAGGAFMGSAEEGEISSASRADYAEAAAVALSNENHKGKLYELAGDKSYTLTNLAAEISKQTGKSVPYNNLPEDEYATILKSFGLPEMFAAAIANWDVSASKGDLFDDSKQLSTLISRPTTPMADTVKAALA